MCVSLSLPPPVFAHTHTPCFSVPIHRHALRIPAQFAIGRGTDGSAAGVAGGAALLQRQKLFRAEGFVVDLRRRLDEVLQVGAREEVAEVDKFAVVLILD